MKDNLLPLGSIVYLQGGTAKVMIINRGSVFEQDGHDVYTDYMGILYPQGFDPDNGVFFNAEDIDKVLFKGYSDDDEVRYGELFEDWKKNNSIPKAKI